ncbi:DUF4355 domain-containing protein [Ornithinibacillus sp. JPR2-1]|uniref:DUF4355 domain-containing protein n=1 Tax=Ornithinibacillus sp. JPR2-1 TaxID=2094019 RepID=UPI0031D814AE
MLKSDIEKMKNVIDSKNLMFPEPLRLNLQFFADGGDGEGSGDEGTDSGGEGEGTDQQEKVELTAEELQKKIESESDRKLAKALEKKQKEWEEKQQEAIQKALEEKERLSKLSEKERKEEEMSKREKELAAREAEIERKQLKADAITDLTGKGLPSSFADFLLADNAENTLENINNFKKAFDEAVNAAVKEKLRQDTPPGGGGGTGKGTNTIAQLRNQKDKQQNKAPDIWAQK